MGLLTAVAADGPEIGSALFALIKGQHSVSVGVLVGSNAFNLAAMVGLSALLAGSVVVPREVLALEGSVGVAITLIAAALLFGWLSSIAAVILAACILVPYLVVVIGGSEWVLTRERGIPMRGFLARALAGRPQRGESETTSDPTHHLLALAVFDVVLIIAGSAGMVEAGLALGDRWHVSRAVLGVLVLAPLTSLPNALTGVRLGLARRGAALVGETFNSNTINLGAGVIIPALFTTLAALTSTAKLQLAWLIAMTAVCTGFLARSGGLARRMGGILLLMYLGFVLVQVLPANP